MEIRLAESAGYCFGVQRALDKVEEQIKNAGGSGHIYTYGPIIHNSEVVKELEERGVFAVDDLKAIKDPENSTLIIRSHGVGRAVQDEAERLGLNIIDATCPFVKKIHRIVEKETLEGAHAVIAGDEEHPEVQGIIGWSRGRITVVKDEAEAENFKALPGERIVIAAQTTFNRSKFEYIVEKILKKGYDTHIMNTICNATSERQSEAAGLADWADTMIVIGDRASSNTRKLVQICRARCKDTYHIQTVYDLTVTSLQFGTCVGITAGASTPNNIIQEVLVYVRGNHFQ